MKKKIISLILTVVLCMLPLTSVMATISFTPSDVSAMEKIKPAIERVLGALQGAGMIMGIFILTFVGFKYLTGGVFEKAKTKDALVPFIIGAFVVMAAPSLVKWVWDMAN